MSHMHVWRKLAGASPSAYSILSHPLPCCSLLEAAALILPSTTHREMKAGTSEPAAATSTSTPSSAAAQKQAEMGQYAEKMYFGASGELEFARNIEMTNGRWAMMGFLAAVMVEAATGEGILGQLISYCKWSGLLGERSGV